MSHLQRHPSSLSCLSLPLSSPVSSLADFDAMSSSERRGSCADCVWRRIRWLETEKTTQSEAPTGRAYRADAGVPFVSQTTEAGTSRTEAPLAGPPAGEDAGPSSPEIPEEARGATGRATAAKQTARGQELSAAEGAWTRAKRARALSLSLWARLEAIAIAAGVRHHKGRVNQIGG